MNMWSKHYVLGNSSIVYMDSTAVYYLRAPGKPGIRANLRLGFSEAEDLRNYLADVLDLPSED